MIDISSISDEQFDFIKLLFGITKEEIERMDIAEWREKIFLPCADLEGELYPKDDKNISNTCRIACELVSLSYDFFDKSLEVIDE